VRSSTSRRTPRGHPQVVATRIELEPKAPVRNSRNRTVQFQKSDIPVLSRPVAVRNAVRLQRGASPPAKRRLDDGETRITTALEVEAAANRSN
jgi:hypothetical protein